jgi:predicted dehydrogenase
VLRVGLIGCGKIARAHVPYIRAYQGATIVGVCDTNLQQAEALARQFQIGQAYSDPLALLAAQQPDVVHILTPPQTHARLAIAAMEAGAHVLVEKPMAVSVEEADCMAATARRMGVHLCVDHNRLFDPVTRQAKQMVRRGDIGEVVGVEAFQGYVRLNSGAMPDDLSSAGAWVAQLPGGLLQNIAPHPISLLLTFMPEARLVSVVTKQTGFCPGTPFEEVRVIFEGERGLGLLTFSLSPQPYLNYLTIYGSQASLQLNLNNNTLIVYKERRLPKLLAKGWFNIDQCLQLLSNTLQSSFQVLTGKMSFYPGMEYLIRSYYTCLEKGGSPPITAEEGRAVVEVFERICHHAQVL